MNSSDPMAAERFRTVVSEAIREFGYNAYGAGREADPHDAANQISDRFESARFVYSVNDAGVPMRQVVALTTLEVDPARTALPRCGDRECPNWGSEDFGEGTCPAEHALTDTVQRPTPAVPTQAMVDAAQSALELARRTGDNPVLAVLDAVLPLTGGQVLAATKSLAGHLRADLDSEVAKRDALDGRIRDAINDLVRVYGFESPAHVIVRDAYSGVKQPADPHHLLPAIDRVRQAAVESLGEHGRSIPENVLPEIFEAAKDRNEGREPDHLHLCYEVERTFFLAENDELRRKLRTIREWLANYPTPPAGQSVSMDPEMSIVRGLRAVLDGRGGDPLPAPIPHRGDAVAAWLKTQRDEHGRLTDEWHAIDHLLDEYRDHADTGTPLHRHGIGPGGVEDSDCLTPVDGVCQCPPPKQVGPHGKGDPGVMPTV